MNMIIVSSTRPPTARFWDFNIFGIELALLAVNHRITPFILWFTAIIANYISKSQYSSYRDASTRYDYHIYHKHTDVCQKFMEKMA